ncbi:MAG: hypothetical protein HUJ30_03900, partial [Gammaproteobacteria bacterium]|nr:hypothetical protein [Gammaproteobacteria bacterium]
MLASAAPGPLPNSPLFLSTAVKPNIIMALDDSGSMDSEVLMPTNDAALWWNTNISSFTGKDINDRNEPGVLNFNKRGSANDTWKKYIYLFPNGQSGSYNGQRIYGDSADAHFAVPPYDSLSYAR